MGIKTNKIGMEFVYIEPGSFMMGSPEDEVGRFDYEIQHAVYLTRGFYLQATPVTQGQWKAIMGNNPSVYNKAHSPERTVICYQIGDLRAARTIIYDVDDCGDDNPVECVSWFDSQEFIKKLNRIEKTDKYRLPTEAEWEYACRAGTDTPFTFGKCISTDQANFHGTKPDGDCPKGIKRGKTTPVKTFSPNHWGIYDMHGNIHEWCQDWAAGNYHLYPAENPRGPIAGTFKVTRGGNFWLSARFCRSAFRGRPYKPEDKSTSLGFRLVKDI